MFDTDCPRGTPEKYFKSYGRSHVDLRGAPASIEYEFKIRQFLNLIHGADYPCVGAKAAFARKNYRIGFHGQMGSMESTPLLAEHLYKYILELSDKTVDSLFASYVAIFEERKLSSEEEAHYLLWEQLQKLHLVDRTLFKYASGVSSDPNANDFAFSVGETAFFVVGMNPCAHRSARRFAYPTLVFNAHSQFQELRRTGEYSRIQEVTRARDIKLHGHLNSNIANFGEKPESFQYSGIDSNVTCPFNKKNE